MTSFLSSLRKRPGIRAHSKCRTDCRRTSFTQLEQLLLLSASPVAELDQQVHVDESLSWEWGAHKFHDVFDIKHISDYPTLLHHLKDMKDHWRHDKDADKKSNSDDSWHHNDDADADHDQLPRPDDDERPAGTVYALNGELDLSGERGDFFEVPHNTDFELQEGTIEVCFTADDVSGLNALFSKDFKGKRDGGDLTAFVRKGRVAVKFQSDEKSVWLKTAKGSIQEGQEYHLTVTFGDAGFWVYLDGLAVDRDTDFTQGLEENTQNLVIGANTWGRNHHHPTKARHNFDGRISEFNIYDSQYDQSEVADLACGTPDVEPVSVNLDFGTSLSPLADGFQRVTSSTMYSSDLGYGWDEETIANVDERDRGVFSGDELTRDFNFAEEASFAIDLPTEPGVYTVTVTMGDGLLSTPPREYMGVLLEGELAGTVDTQPGDFVTEIYEVTVSDGQLNLLFADLGGNDPFVIINSIVVEGPNGAPTEPPAELEPEPTPEPPVNAEPDPTPTEPEPPVIIDPPAPPAPAPEPPVVVDPAPEPPAPAPEPPVVIDLAPAPPPPAPEPPVVVDPAPEPPAPAPEPPVVIDPAPAPPAPATEPPVVIDPAPAPPASAPPAPTPAPLPVFSVNLDLGPSNSPAPSGFEIVTASTTYSPLLGYGWTSGTVYERDRGVGFGSHQSQDFNFTTQASFAIEVLPEPGVYDVTVTMGDGLTNTPTRDDMGVFLEGVQVDSVTSRPGQFVTTTYQVTVTDGQLNLSLQDLGGADPYVIANSIEVNYVEPAATV